MADSAQAPPWEYLPAEQYLIRNWDASSPLSRAEQRKQLVGAFLKLDAIPNEWNPRRNGQTVSRVPTDEEVCDILAPWRPDKVRKIARGLQGEGTSDHFVILRTYYGSPGDDDGGDRKIEEYLDREEDQDAGFLEDCTWWRVLDDRDLFEFGDDWERVSDVLPELVTRGSTRDDGSKGPSPSSLAQTWEHEDDPEDELRYWMCWGQPPLLVADADSFADEAVFVYRLLWLDAKANVVKYSEIKPGDIGLLRGAIWDLRVRNTDWWEDRDLGEMYEEDGEIGRVLYVRPEGV